jgi:hypothetical protein
MEFNGKYHAEVMHDREHLGIVLQVQTDPRKVMRAAYTSFRDGIDPVTILDAVGPQPNSHDLFYARLVCPQLSFGLTIKTQKSAQTSHIPFPPGRRNHLLRWMIDMLFTNSKRKSGNVYFGSTMPMCFSTAPVLIQTLSRHAPRALK